MESKLKTSTLVFLILLASAFSSCIEDENQFEEQVNFEEELLNDYFERNDITATRDNSGIYYQVLESNPDGVPVEEGNILSIHYVMRTLSGTMVDSLQSSSQETDTLVRFQHVGGALYPEGINLGVRLMNEGEKFRIFMPSYRAFHDFSYKTLIPSGSILIADIEVAEVASLEDMEAEEKQQIQEYIASHQLDSVQEEPSGIFYQRIEAGSGDTVKDGTHVEISYKGYFLNDEVFDESEVEQPIKFTVGYHDDIIPGFEEGIKLMKEGEKGRIFIPSHLAYGAGVQVIPDFVRNSFLKYYNLKNVAPFRTLIFEVELKDIQ